MNSGNQIKQAVCVLIPFGDKYLAVSRRNDTTQWGFPGGKVDAYESASEAAKRELNEETGLYIDTDLLIPIYSGLAAGEVDYWVTSFLYEQGSDPHENLELIPEEGLTIELKDPEDLSDTSCSPFALYNRSVFHALGEYWSVNS
jgi:8-oxo-dGTP pyrophosphatase MutT (NUDIX family)